MKINTLRERIPPTRVSKGFRPLVFPEGILRIKPNHCYSKKERLHVLLLIRAKRASHDYDKARAAPKRGEKPNFPSSL